MRLKKTSCINSYILPSKKEALYKWSLCNRGNYQILIGIFCSQREVSLAETLAKYLDSKERPRNIQVLDIFHWCLKDSYKYLPHPSSEQWPSRLSQHFPTSIQCFHDLLLHKAPLREILHGLQSSVKSSHTLNCTLRLRKLLVYF